MSAKERQFSGIQNDYFDISPADYNDLESFLKTLGHNLGFNDKELDETSTIFLKNKVKEGLKHFPSLIIVDNVDSLSDDDQKRVIDTCRQLGSSNYHKKEIFIFFRNLFRCTWIKFGRI